MSEVKKWDAIRIYHPGEKVRERGIGYVALKQNRGRRPGFTPEWSCGPEMDLPSDHVIFGGDNISKIESVKDADYGETPTIKIFSEEANEAARIKFEERQKDPFRADLKEWYEDSTPMNELALKSLIKIWEGADKDHPLYDPIDDLFDAEITYEEIRLRVGDLLAGIEVKEAS